MNLRQKITLSLLLTFVLGGAAFPQVVDIQDPNLRAAIQDALNLPDDASITQADMLQLTEFESWHSQIADLTGLEYATNLTVLKLYANPFEDIRPLETLTQLTELHLTGSKIVDLSPLANLTQLTYLRLNDIFRIEDISPLTNLTQLRVAHLDHNLIDDIGPLAGLTRLEELDLRYNRIIDVSPLANLTQLTRLYLNNNRILDISPLANIPNLEHLDTHDNPIFDQDSPLVEIPDPNLRAAVREALNLPDGIPLTQAYMRQLTRLDAGNKHVTTLTGLEHAVNLTELNLARNNISDLIPIVSPLTNLTQLTELHLGGNQIENIGPLANLIQLKVVHLDYTAIVDVGPLAHLTNLEFIDLRRNLIINVRPLANLTQLTELNLYNNRIVDVSPLANLTNLEVLDIRVNPVTNLTPLDGLSLTYFLYDEICELPPFPVNERIDNRSHPSIFTPWSDLGWISVRNRTELSDFENMASHDLWFSRPQFGLNWVHAPEKNILVRKLVGNLDEAMRQRDEFLARNPNMIFLLSIPFRAFHHDVLPEDWPHWTRDVQGNRFIWPDGHVHIDFGHPEVQESIVRAALAVERCGLYDGIMIDHWREDAHLLHGYRTHEEELAARENILRRIRAETRPDFLILANVNISQPRRDGHYINGLFMETGVPGNEDSRELEIYLNEIESTLLWANENLREPHIHGLEGSGDRTKPPFGPTNLRAMRAMTTLSLTHSDGYVLLDEGGDHLHYWYDFWDADLGQPLREEKAQLYEGRVGLYIREFTNGWAVYNRSGETQEITLPELVTSVATGVESTTHTLPNYDGEMYLRMKPQNPADVNGDGVVNILDLTLVARAFGKDGLQGDVNGDGVVNVFDLVQVAGAIGGGGAAPSAYSLDPSIVSAADVEKWLALAQGLGVGDANFQRGIRFLEQLLAALTPKETTLLPNYPNPFNPETWIPYRLAQEAEVAITIYDTKGTQVRRLALGNQAAGHYAERGKAAYWDGRNEDGEAVASGIYMYQFRAGDYAASRRMVIVK